MKSRQKKISGVIAALIIALFTWGYDYFVAEQGSSTPIQTIQTANVNMSKIWTRGRHTSAAENATQHFIKHGKEFGFKTEAEYVTAAIDFTTKPSADVMQNIQRDGDTAFYNPKSAEYAVKSKRGLIRTYFKLDPKIHGFQSNTDYFNAQANGRSKPPANDNQQRSN